MFAQGSCNPYATARQLEAEAVPLPWIPTGARDPILGSSSVART
jgi:hypothetical protein